MTIVVLTVVFRRIMLQIVIIIMATLILIGAFVALQGILHMIA